MFQETDLTNVEATSKLLTFGSGVGFSSNDKGVQRLCTLFDSMARMSETGEIRRLGNGMEPRGYSTAIDIQDAQRCSEG